MATDDATPETWKPVVGNEMYAVSDLGRVRSFYAGRGSGKRGGLLRQALTGGITPRLCVALSAGGKAKTRLVHHLVLEAFVGPRPAGQEALHGPGGAFDNRLANLSWGSREQNQMDRVRDGTSNRGERQWQSKFTEEDVIECRRRYAAGETQQALASEFGVDGGTMSQAITGTNWAWLPGAVPIDRTRHGRQGVKHHAAKLTAEIVLECRRRFANGENSYALAREFGVAQPTMHKAIIGGTWKHV